MNEMEVISHLNVSVGLFPFTKILNLNIDHGPNVFGLCTIVGEMDHESADEIAQRTDESSETEVVTTASGQPARLFCGVVKNVSVNHQNEYAKVTVVLEGTCKKLDIQTHQRSYQDTTATYGDLIRKSISGEGTAEITVTDKQTGQLIVQYDETNWDFCIRMASQLGAPVFSDVQADEPHLYVGLPPSDQVKDLSTAEFQMAKSTMSNQMQTGKIVVSEDASDAGLKSYCYVFAGNFVKVDARFYAVKSISAEMKDGILEMNYGLLPMGNEAHESADEIAQRTDESSETEVVTTASGQPARLFCGVVKNVSVNHQNEYAKVTVVLEGTCKKLDIQTHQRSYQDTTATYGDLIRKSISGEGTAEITVTDKQTGQLIVQYDETNWDFCIRMASQLGAPVFSDVQADEPHLYVGLPPSDQVKDLSTAEFQMAKSTMSNQMQTGKIVVSEDASDAGLKSYCYVFAGNFVKVDARFYAVKSISAEMKDGILEMNYGLLPMGNEAPTAGATTDVKGLAVSAGMNQNCSGKMFTGTVKNVSGSKVQVQFSFDSEFSGNHWFEYSTAYSSSDQSGWYCMPEVGDTVRVFFPSGNEGQAFASSSAPRFMGQSPKDKVWMAHGKCIQLTEKGIKISCDGEEAFIDLTPDEGITISCKKDLNVNAEGEVKVQAETIKLIADEKISLGTDRAFIDITDETITLLGKEVIVE